MKIITKVITEAIENGDKEYVLVLVTRILNDANSLSSELIELRDILNKYYGELLKL